ncbi:MAG TPA: PEP-CTERM sorting domain-containing protein [Terriglobales bacterium]|nr:PEP-CTERM sorting domain-containing protein [Terriglobales bacterium]
MKISQICAVVMLLVVGSVLAFADGIHDPKIVIHGVNGGNGPLETCPPAGCTDVGFNFNFSVPKFGTGQVFFTNDSGKNWTSLTLVENGVPAADISCVQTEFLNCSTKTLQNGSVEIILSGVRGGTNPRNGILNGQSFVIQFSCVGNSCWPGGTGFSGHASAAPEPGTVALMVTGLGALISRRKQLLSRLRS